jgi:hypothetical protein
MREEDRLRSHREEQREAMSFLCTTAVNARRKEREELDLGRNEELIQHRGDTYEYGTSKCRTVVYTAQ